MAKQTEIPPIVMGLSYNSNVGLGLLNLTSAYDVIFIEADGIKYRLMSREAFLREFHRDLLVEEWAVACRFLGIAYRKDGNDIIALTTLERIITMKLKELKDKSMAELVDMHAELAKAAGVKPVKKFKSLEVARIEVIKLANAKPASGAKKKSEPSGKGAEGRPRTGVGEFAKGKISEGLGNKEVLEAVQAQFPENSTSLACIAYYRSKMIKAGTLEKKTKADEKPVKGKGKKKADEKPVKGKKRKAKANGNGATPETAEEAAA